MHVLYHCFDELGNITTGNITTESRKHYKWRLLFIVANEDDMKKALPIFSNVPLYNILNNDYMSYAHAYKAYSLSVRLCHCFHITNWKVFQAVADNTSLYCQKYWDTNY